MYKIFETERLILRPTTKEDAEFIFQLLNSPKWLEFIGDRNIRTVEDAENFIDEKMLTQLYRLGFSNYTIIRKTDLKKIGTCGLYDREGLEGIDIGYALLPEFEGKGYAFEAAEKIKNVALVDFRLGTINGITSKENMASQKLLQKLGLKLFGTKKLPGEEVELMFFQLQQENILKPGV